MPVGDGSLWGEVENASTSRATGDSPKHTDGGLTAGSPDQAACTQVQSGHDGGHCVPCGSSSLVQRSEQPASSRPASAETRGHTPQSCSTSISESIRDRARPHPVFQETKGR